MLPFKVSPHIVTVRDTYPSAADIAHVAAYGGEESRLALARLWLSEGIPFAFREVPGIYEAIRAWLSIRLTVDPKEITIIGSARVGQALSPGESFGKPFSEKSDIDLSIVSLSLFERLRDEFNAWAYDYETDKVKPRNAREKTFWDDNLSRVPKILQRGFIDAKLIPLFKKYPIAQSIGQTMYLLREKLLLTEGAPKVIEASLRVYRDWDSFAKQLALNLSFIARRG
jgi:hypothetical protein